MCCDTFDVDEGVECESGDESKHFTCNGCFSGYVRSKVDEESFRLLVAKGGAIFCPFFQCAAPSLKPKVIAAHVEEEVFEEYQAAVKKMEEQRINATLGTLGARGLGDGRAHAPRHSPLLFLSPSQSKTSSFGWPRPRRSGSSSAKRNGADASTETTSPSGS